MSTLVSAVGVASQAVAHDPRSDVASEAIAAMVQEIEEFLTTPPYTLLSQLEPEARLAARRAMAGEVRRLIGGLRNMLSVAAQVEQYGGPVSWAPPLGEAIRRLEAEFQDIPDLSRQTPPPIVRPTEGPLETWRVEPGRVNEPADVYSTAPRRVQDSPGDESLDDILEDTMDLIKAQHIEAMARVRGEQPLDWESVRRDLNDD